MYMHMEILFNGVRDLYFQELFRLSKPTRDDRISVTSPKSYLDMITLKKKLAPRNIL
jgi:hypothetical protein